jgi:hypothetical protein
MNDVTEDVPACAGTPTIAAVAPGITRSIAARYTAEDTDGTRAPLPPEAERALSELEAALDLHGAPDPERTAAWFGALGRGERA